MTEAVSQLRLPSAPRAASRRPPSLTELRAVLAVTLAAGIAGALAGAEPAGWWLADALWSGAFAAVVTYGASRARRWTWVVLGGGPLALASGPVGAAAAVVAFVLAAVVATGRRRTRLAGAVVAALSVNLLLRLSLDTAGLSAVVTAVAVTPALVSA